MKKRGKRQEISFTKDIIREAAQKLDMPIDKVEDVYKSMTSYIYKMTRDGETLSIRLPYVGVLCATYDGIRKKIKTYKNYGKEYRSKLEKMETLQLRFEMSGNFGLMKHLRKRFRKMGFYTAHYPIEKIQEIQNKLFNEKSK